MLPPISLEQLKELADSILGSDPLEQLQAASLEADPTAYALTWAHWFAAMRVDVTRLQTQDGRKLSIDGTPIRLDDAAGTGASAWPAPALLRVGRHIWRLTPSSATRITLGEP